TNPGDVALATGVVPTVRYGNYGGDRCPVCGYRDLLGHGRCRSWSGYREVQPAPACGAADDPTGGHKAVPDCAGFDDRFGLHLRMGVEHRYRGHHGADRRIDFEPRALH